MTLSEAAEIEAMVVAERDGAPFGKQIRAGDGNLRFEQSQLTGLRGIRVFDAGWSN
jgi:hypothetical protein